MPALAHDTPTVNQTSHSHAMMAAMSSYLDGVATIGSIREAHLDLAKQFVADAKKAAGLYEELLVAEKLEEALHKLYGKGMQF